VTWEKEEFTGVIQIFKLINQNEPVISFQLEHFLTNYPGKYHQHLVLTEAIIDFLSYYVPYWYLFFES